MSLIKCPECGHDLSTEANFCPNCGYKPHNQIESQKNNKEDLVVLVKRRRNSGAVGFGIFLIIIGVLATALIIGIFIVLLGITKINEGNTNNANSHECVCYDRKNKVLVLYSYDGGKYAVDPDKVFDFWTTVCSDSLRIRIIREGVERRIDCGSSVRFKPDQFKQWLEEMRQGVFDPDNISI